MLIFIAIFLFTCRIRGAYFLVRDRTEPKTAKVLQWLDNGPFRALSERALASLARSIQQMEVSTL